MEYAEGISSPAKRFDELPGRDDGDALPETRGEVPDVPGDEEVRMRGEGDLEERRVLRVGKLPGDRFSDDQLSDGLETSKEARDAFRGKAEPGTGEDLAVFVENDLVETGDDRPGFEEAKNVGGRAVRRDETQNQNIRVEDDSQRRRLARTSLITALISRRVMPFGNLMAESR